MHEPASGASHMPDRINECVYSEDEGSVSRAISTSSRYIKYPTFQ